MFQRCLHPTLWTDRLRESVWLRIIEQLLSADGHAPYGNHPSESAAARSNILRRTYCRVKNSSYPSKSNLLQDKCSLQLHRARGEGAGGNQRRALGTALVAHAGNLTGNFLLRIVSRSDGNVMATTP